jgi:hypothetical protein
MKLVSSGDVRPELGAAERFTEGGWQAEILEAQRGGGMRVHGFFHAQAPFPIGTARAGSRHATLTPEGTVLSVKLGEVLETAPGDLVYVTPSVKHWHTASADSLIVHFPPPEAAPTGSRRARWEK